MTFGNTTYLGLFNFTYNISHFTMEEFSMDYDQSVIKFQEKSPNIILQFIDFTMKLTMDFSLTTDPLFYYDVGPAQIDFLFKNIDIGLTIQANKDGVFQFVPEFINSTYVGGKSYFSGTGDISYVLNNATQIIDGMLSQNATNVVGFVVNTVVGQINGQLLGGG